MKCPKCGSLLVKYNEEGIAWYGDYEDKEKATKFVFLTQQWCCDICDYEEDREEYDEEEYDEEEL